MPGAAAWADGHGLVPPPAPPRARRRRRLPATFLVLVRKATSIRQRELVGNWLYGAAYRAALEVKAAKRRAKERQVSAMPEPVVVDEAAVWRDLRRVLDQELNRLPDKYRVPV